MEDVGMSHKIPDVISDCSEYCLKPTLFGTGFQLKQDDPGLHINPIHRSLIIYLIC